MIAVALALASSLGYGSADFAGGLASRKTHVLPVLAAAAPAGLLLYLLLLPVIGAQWSSPAILWGAASGVATAATFALLYQTLALGPMNILAPLTAVISAVIPVGVGLLQGERLSTPALIGLFVALVAIVFVGGGLGIRAGRPSGFSLVLATAAGASIAAQLVCLHQAPASSGLTPVLVGRIVSAAIVWGAFLSVHRRRAFRPVPWKLAMGSGALSAFANLAFLLAVRAGDLSIVAVITALYPATTVALARLVLRERFYPTQVAGLAAAALAVSLLALG